MLGSFVHGDSPDKNTGMGLPCPPPRDLPNPGTEPRSPALQEDSLPSEPHGSPEINTHVYKKTYSEELTHDYGS